MYTALRTFCPLRPTRFDCEAMTFPEMTVRAMNEILLRIEISGRGEEGFSARRPNGPGVGTAATSAALPLEKNRDKGVNGEWAVFWRLA